MDLLTKSCMYSCSCSTFSFSLSFQVRKVNIRLLGPVVDDYISEGIVQVEHKGKWGYICPSAWTPVNSFVLCGQLGFPNSEKQGSYSVALQEVEPVYWLDKVSCQGWESSIVSCLHAGFDRHQCSDTGGLRIKCVRRNITKVSTSSGTPSAPAEDHG